MTLKDLLFDVVSDGQEVKLIGDDFGEITGVAAALKNVLSKDVEDMTVIGIEAEYDGVLKVWVKDEEGK